MAAEQIERRMQAAIDTLNQTYHGRRVPKAFYLGSADWDDFMSVERETGFFEWGNNPPKTREDPVFNGLPVRPSLAESVPPRQSKLYDHSSSGRTLPPFEGEDDGA